MCFSWTRKWAKSGEIVQNRPGSCFSWPRQTAPRSRCGGAAGTARNARCGAQSGIATRHARLTVATRCGLRSRITAISHNVAIQLYHPNRFLYYTGIPQLYSIGLLRNSQYSCTVTNIKRLRNCAIVNTVKAAERRHVTRRADRLPAVHTSI